VAAVLERLRVAAAAAPWSLEFDALIGDQPAQGGVLRFSVPVMGSDRDPSLSRFVYQASRVCISPGRPIGPCGDRTPTETAVQAATEARRRAEIRPPRAGRPSRGTRSRRMFGSYSNDPD